MTDPTSREAAATEGRDWVTGELKWTGSRVDLVFGSNSDGTTSPDPRDVRVGRPPAGLD